ncbi:MAG TPA: hypothetical protein VEF04_09350 [Blastocatellia bacterium]|nr:hypothetical protein [Blastocatellia bacterium]
MKATFEKVKLNTQSRQMQAEDATVTLFSSKDISAILDGIDDSIKTGLVLFTGYRNPLLDWTTSFDSHPEQSFFLQTSACVYFLNGQDLTDSVATLSDVEYQPISDKKQTKQIPVVIITHNPDVRWAEQSEQATKETYQQHIDARCRIVFTSLANAKAARCVFLNVDAIVSGSSSVSKADAFKMLLESTKKYCHGTVQQVDFHVRNDCDKYDVEQLSNTFNECATKYMDEHMPVFDNQIKPRTIRYSPPSSSASSTSSSSLASTTTDSIASTTMTTTTTTSAPSSVIVGNSRPKKIVAAPMLG